MGDILLRNLMMIALGVAALNLGGCVRNDVWDASAEPHLPPVLGPLTEANKSLQQLPPASLKVRVAVYAFADQTGQMKPSETVQSYSRAVTQGGTSILVKALLDAGGGRWFTVIEREKIDNLSRERAIIADTRKLYDKEDNINPAVLPPLMHAGFLLDGGIIGYDYSTRTGGAAARYLGLGGEASYRQDVITVSLRAISTKSGEVLASVVVHKTIASVTVEGGVNKYIASTNMLEAKANYSRDEPGQIAVQEAIEKAVFALTVDGASRGLWSFKDKAVQARLIAEYRKEQAGSGYQQAKAGTGQER